MILGNNNSNNTFASNGPTKINPIIKDNRTKQHTDVTNKDEMADKAFDTVEQRYRNGLISLEEYTKQCNKIGKIRKNK